MLTGDELLSIDDVGGPRRLEVKAWGGKAVWLRQATADMRDEWESFCVANQGKPASWRAKLASLLLCNEQGDPLFTAADVPKLGRKSAAALHEIWEAGLPLLKVTDEEVRELAGN